jgi:hypothetical protein
MSQQAVFSDIILNSDVGIFSPKTEGTKTKAAWVLMRHMSKFIFYFKFYN